MMEFINLDGLRIKTLKFNIKDTSEFVNRTVFDSGLDLNVCKSIGPLKTI